jgi:aminopeptidase N
MPTANRGSYRQGPMLKSRTSTLFALAVLFALLGPCRAQQDKVPEGFTRQDQLRGSITEERAWWDLLHYDLALQVMPATKSLQGTNQITFKVLQAGDRMQIDLQPPLKISRVTYGDSELQFESEGKAHWIKFSQELTVGAEQKITVHYEGRPRESTRPPWSGGLSWKKDEQGRDFIATTCQGIGASIWWPCKDHGYDEPDRGMDMRITVPEALTAVSNGRLLATTRDEANKTRTFHWRVVNPINNYGVNVNIGHYVSMDGDVCGRRWQAGLAVLDARLPAGESEETICRGAAHARRI